MTKTESLARKVLGWKLNRWDRWYDYEKGVFIQTTDFQPEQKLDHAMLLVERLQNYGFKYSTDGRSEACFNNVKATGNTLAEAITNAAYSLIEANSVTNSNRLWQKLC